MTPVPASTPQTTAAAPAWTAPGAASTATPTSWSATWS